MYAPGHLAAACAIAGLLATHASAVKASPEPAAIQDRAVLPEKLYDGWRASELLDSHVFSRGAEYLGRVRNVVVADNGQIEALILEGEQLFGKDSYDVSRVPWQRFARPIHPGVLIADVADARPDEFALFPQQNEPNGQRPDFLVTELLGDYARLKTGKGYGYVKDVVFSQQGRLLAVLIARDAPAGSGTYAFKYPGQTGRWDARMSYYGLPYVTPDQATERGYAVDMRKFGSRNS